jgi:hypothetical protein
MTRPTGADIPQRRAKQRPTTMEAADSARLYILHVTAWDNGEQAVLDYHRQFFEIFPQSRPQREAVRPICCTTLRPKELIADEGMRAKFEVRD